MNLTSDEAKALGTMFSGQPAASLQTFFSTNMFVVVQLEMDGDPNTDPVRQAWAFFDQTRATTFANTLKSASARSAVIVYQGSTVVQLNDPAALVGIWQGRSTWGQPLPNAHTNELSDLATVASAAKAAGAATIVDSGKHTKDAPKKKVS